MEPVAMTPIGVVRNEIKRGTARAWREVVSELRLRRGLEAALDGLEEFSHLLVLFYFHRSSPEFPMKVHPRGREDLPLVGVLASRHYSRPCPIGLTVVRLLERRGRVLRVQGLDAFDGTPVLDIKPFIPGFDLPPPQEVRFPDWVLKIQEMPRLALPDVHR